MSAQSSYLRVKVFVGAILIACLFVLRSSSGTDQVVYQQMLDALSQGKGTVGVPYWHLDNTGAGEAREDADIDLKEALKISRGCQVRVRVAVLDGEFNRIHDDLRGSFTQGYDAVAEDANPFATPTNELHATAITSAMRDVAKDARITPVRMMKKGTATVDDLIQAMEWSVQHARPQVINISAGAPRFTISDSTATQLKGALEEAVASGAVVVLAAGNEGVSNAPDYEWGFYPASLAHLPGVVSVGASDARDNLLDTSNQDAELAAPGLGVVVAASGRKDRTMVSGTSVAAPLVSGALALAKSCHPKATPRELEDALLASSDPIDAGVLSGRLNAADLLLKMKAHRFLSH